MNQGENFTVYSTQARIRWGGGGGSTPPPLGSTKHFFLGVGGGGIQRPFFFCLSMSERLVMYDGYLYSVSGEKCDGVPPPPPPPPPHQLFQAWRGIDHGMYAMSTPPPPLHKILCTPLTVQSYQPAKLVNM